MRIRIQNTGIGSEPEHNLICRSRINYPDLYPTPILVRELSSERYRQYRKTHFLLKVLNFFTNFIS